MKRYTVTKTWFVLRKLFMSHRNSVSSRYKIFVGQNSITLLLLCANRIFGECGCQILTTETFWSMCELYLSQMCLDFSFFFIKTMYRNPSVTHKLYICQTPISISEAWGDLKFSKVHAKCLSQADLF